MPPDTLLVVGDSVDEGRPLYLSYAVCYDLDEEEAEDEVEGEEGQFSRELKCGAMPVPLPTPSRLAAEPGHADPCVMLVERVPPDLPAGVTCRFEVILERPGGVPETRTREFSILPISSRTRS
jgi:hypothetical protein